MEDVWNNLATAPNSFKFFIEEFSKPCRFEKGLFFHDKIDTPSSNSEFFYIHYCNRGSQKPYVPNIEAIIMHHLGMLTDRLTRAQQYMTRFTLREQEVAKLLLSGLNNQEIAHTMNLSVETIKSKLKNLFYKTKTNNKIELAIHLLENKFFSISPDVVNVRRMKPITKDVQPHGVLLI